MRTCATCGRRPANGSREPNWGSASPSSAESRASGTTRAVHAEVVCPRDFWDQLLREGLNLHADGHTLHAPAGLVTLPGRMRFLVREPFKSHTHPSGPAVRVQFRSGRPLPSFPAQAPLPRADLVLGIGPAEGCWWGLAWTAPDRTLPVSEISLPGPGMFRLRKHPDPDTPAVPETRWTRTRAALGEAAWRRLTSLRVGIVGCGRLGSTLAAALARNGVRHLLLVDPDIVEPHNLGETDGLDPLDINTPKVQVLARYLSAACPWTHLRAVPASVHTYAALHHLKGCDLLICAADSPAAREACGLLAARYHLVLVETGTGVFTGDGGGRVLGAEVRLVLPGQSCRNCMEQDRQPQDTTPLPWWADRMGSLRSLNLLAAGMTLLLIEGLARGDCRASGEARWVWGEPSRWSPAPPCGPPGCLRPVAGVGDEHALAAAADHHQEAELPR
jgi:molybdopterin/thiamine biosynthesis adenylyltransferase